jgi:hypothetical protein
MTFDFIIGNPPYQYPKNVNGYNNQKKLYIDISVKCVSLLKDEGELNFLTPQAILKVGHQKKCKQLVAGFFEVNFDANKHFPDVGQKIVAFRYNHTPATQIKVISEGESRIVNDIHQACRKKDIALYSIVQKIDRNLNGRTRLDIVKELKGQPRKRDISPVPTEIHTHEVICNTKRQRIKFAAPVKVPFLKLMIPMLGGWEEGCFLTYKMTNEFWYCNKHEETIETLIAWKAYLESKLIAYCQDQYRRKVSPTMSYAFCTRLPEIDFTRPLTDEEIYQEFNLTQFEIDEIEAWCIKKPHHLPKHNNPGYGA